MELFNKYKHQLEMLHTLGMYEDKNNYICPICLREYTEEQATLLSLEDVPQAALGGCKRLLTCKSCNNEMGRLIDCHLVNYIEAIEDKAFLPGTVAPVVIECDNMEGNIRGAIKVMENHVELHLHKNRNHPDTFQDVIRNLKEDDIANLRFENKPNKRLPSHIVSAILRNGYLLLFEQFGYTFLLNDYYDIIRQQITQPDKEILPEGFVHFGPIFNDDGIYKTNSKELNGFFIQYTISKKRDYKCVVFIPLPDMDFRDVSNRLKAIKVGCSLPVKHMPFSECYFENRDVLKDALSWFSAIKLTQQISQTHY